MTQFQESMIPIIIAYIIFITIIETTPFTDPKREWSER
jgi:hypothetical protein